MKIRVLLLLMVLPTSSLIAGEQWLHLKSPNFDVYTDAGASHGREVLSELEQLRNVFVTELPERNISPLPVRVFLFQSQASFRPFQINESSAGYYHSGPAGDYMALRASARTATHEYIHAVLHHAAREVPAWFGEGMAEFYSTVRFRGGQMSVGEPVRSHLQVLRNGKLLGLEILQGIGHDSPYYRNVNKAGMFYAESWALLHMLHLSGKYRAGIANFISMTLRGEPDPLHSAFGRTDVDIERDLRAYIAQGLSPPVDVPISTAEKLGNIPAEPISQLDAAVLLADLFTVSEKRSESGKLLEALVKAHPGSAEAEAALGYLSLQKSQDDIAATHFRRALELGLRNARLCFDLAMLRRDQRAADAEVLDLLRRSVAMDPDLYESRYFLGHLAMVNGHASEALENLKRAADLQPNRPQVWEELALAYEANKDTDRAIDAATRAVRLSTGEAELARAEANLRSLEQRPQSPEAKSTPRPSTGVPATRIEGTLTQIDCLGALARLRVERPSGKIFLLVRDPRNVSLKNAGAVSFEFACGPMEARAAVVEFIPARSETYGTAGEIRSIEFR
jgi:Flp pilus assembly protein TadD